MYVIYNLGSGKVIDIAEIVNMDDEYIIVKKGTTTCRYFNKNIGVATIGNSDISQYNGASRKIYSEGKITIESEI